MVEFYSVLIGIVIFVDFLLLNELLVLLDSVMRIGDPRTSKLNIRSLPVIRICYLYTINIPKSQIILITQNWKLMKSSLLVLIIIFF